MPLLPVTEHQPRAILSRAQFNAAAQSHGRLTSDGQAKTAACTNRARQAVEGIEHTATFVLGNAWAGVDDFDKAGIASGQQAQRHLTAGRRVFQRIVQGTGQDQA